jgi:hydroxyacylglutathione hydrolase
MLQIEAIVSEPFQENTYVVWRPPEALALVIDPGLQPELILDFLQERGLGVAAILNTHGHSDHIAGNAALKEAFPAAPIIIGAGDEVMLSDADANLSAPFGFAITSPPAERTVREGDTIDLAALPLRVLDIPGHSPGHVVFVSQTEPIVVFGGDVLFQGSVGRTDFPGGSARQLITGIRTKLYALPASTIVYPGHGPPTTIGAEMATNPFTSL